MSMNGTGRRPGPIDGRIVIPPTGTAGPIDGFSPPTGPDYTEAPDQPRGFSRISYVAMTSSILMSL